MIPRLKVVRLLPALDFGGVESRVVLQAQLIDRERFDLRVATLHRDGEAGARIRAAGIPVDVLGVSPSIRDPRTTATLAAYLRRQRPDVLHASIAEANFHGALAGAATRVRARILEEVGVPVRSRQARLLQGTAARLAHRVVGVTRATCDWLEREERVPKQRLALVYNCGKPQYFGPVSRVDNPGRLRIFTAGRLVWQKDHVNLVRAFALARRAGLDAELWIAGEGELRAELEAAVQESGFAGDIRLLGFRDDVRALLDRADLFVLPSISEGCSVALIEAMASGIPCFASDIPGNDEVMERGAGGGWLLPPADPGAWADGFRRFADLSPEARASLGLAGRAIAAARFSPEAYLRNVQALYAQVWSERT